MTLHSIAKTGGRFVDFGPYVPAIAHDGRVAFSARTANDEVSVLIAAADRSSVSQYGQRVTSHPAFVPGGVCSYACEGERDCLVRWRETDFDVLDGSRGGDVGPLGPTAYGEEIAYRTNGDVPSVMLAAQGQCRVIARRGAEWAEFHGLPVAVGAGRVLSRGIRTNGTSAIVVSSVESTELVVETGERFAELARFPAAAHVDGGLRVGFAATEASGRSGFYVADQSGIESIVDQSAGFESFRGGLVSANGDLVFFATPPGGCLGVYRVRATSDQLRDHRRVVSVGDNCFGSSVSELALNPVSMNDRGDIAILLHMTCGEQRIVVDRN